MADEEFKRLDKNTDGLLNKDEMPDWLKDSLGKWDGNKDGLIRISQGVHAYLKENNVPHIWHVDEHAHDFQH